MTDPFAEAFATLKRPNTCADVTAFIGDACFRAGVFYVAYAWLAGWP